MDKAPGCLGKTGDASKPKWMVLQDSFGRGQTISVQNK